MEDFTVETQRILGADGLHTNRGIVSPPFLFNSKTHQNPDHAEQIVGGDRRLCFLGDHVTDVTALKLGSGFVSMLSAEAFDNALVGRLRCVGEICPFCRAVKLDHERGDTPRFRALCADLALRWFTLCVPKTSSGFV
jgi:hypothetical protein